MGIGLDAGEAVPVETGYRGGALNLAARLCGRAGPGEILASQAAVHLAQRVEGVRYVDRGDLHLKGLADPVRVFRVVSEEGDPAEGFRRLAPPRPARGPAPLRLARRHPALAVAVALALVAAIVVPTTFALLGRGPGGLIVGDALAMIDPGTGRLEGWVPLESRPGAVAVGPGGIWVTLPDRRAVDQIDPETMTIRNTIPVGADPSDIAIGEGSVWVSNGGSSTVSRISPGLAKEPFEIPVPGGPTGIAVGKGGVWVASSLEASVSRIDPKSNRVRSIGVGDRPAGVAVNDLGAWVANAASGTVSRIDPDTNDVRLVPGVGNGPQAIVAGPDGVWVANSLDGTVAHIDPETNVTDEKIPVGGAPTGLTLAGGSVWVSLGSSGSVARIEPGSGAPPTLIQLGSEANDIALGDSGLWVTVRGAASAHRGGTLTVWALDVWFDSKDPALAYYPVSWYVLNLTNDGLVGFPHRGGLEGTTLVPDMALFLPEPTEGGRRYTFQLRQGLMYSTGEPVRPKDFRRAIERVFANLKPDGNPSDGVPYFSDIVGASACTRTLGQPCDLRDGIVANDAAGTVTFKLRAPDPDFLYALALPFAYAVPAETPDVLGNDSFVSATGPYFVEKYVEGKEIDLARNPRFDSWDAAARPDGFPERIVWRLGSDTDRMVADTVDGEADLTVFPPLPDQIPKLESRYPGQFHRSPRANTSYMSLNTEVRPFNDVDVRRALNFAVDRTKTASLSGNQWLGATCQIIPPTLPGFSPYCPYTLQPRQRTWTAPDLATAQRLVDRSGTADAKVTVWASEGVWPISVPVGRYFVKLLTKLHYRATLKLVDGDALISALDGRAQITFAMWTTDYAAASGFVPLVLECGAGYNYGGFCDKDIDGLMKRATLLRSTDPARALDLWSKVDHDLVNKAPWVPLGNADWVNLASQRLGNYLSNPVWGPLVDQMWVCNAATSEATSEPTSSTC